MRAGDEAAAARVAIQQLDPERLRVLLDGGLDPNARHDLDEPLLNEAVGAWRQGPHGWAAEAVPRLIHALIAAGADLHARGANDFTALHVAACCANRAVCEQLIAAGADPLAVAEPGDSHGGRTPYEVAEDYGRMDIAAFLRLQIPAERLARRAGEKAEARERNLRSIPGRRL